MQRKINQKMQVDRKPHFAALACLGISILALSYTSQFSLQDYHYSLGLSSIIDSSDPVILNDMVGDGEFYKRTFDSIINLGYFQNIGKTFMSGPIPPLILYGASFGNAYILYAIYAILLSLGIFAWSKIICSCCSSETLAKLALAVLCINPFNYYFVLKPGSEIIFFSLFAFFIQRLLELSRVMTSLDAKSQHKQNSSVNGLLIATTILLQTLAMTRPNILVLSLTYIISLAILSNFSPAKKHISKWVIYSCLSLSSLIFCLNIAMYFPYALRGFQNLANVEVHNVTYFGLAEVQIDSYLKSSNAIIRIPLTIMWKTSNWILSICGIRDSFSNISQNITAGKPWQIISRISWGLAIYLPLFTSNLTLIIISMMKALKKKLSKTLLLCILPGATGILLLLPNILLYNNERYIYMIYPTLLISLLQLHSSYDIRVKAKAINN